MQLFLQENYIRLATHFIVAVHGSGSHPQERVVDLGETLYSLSAIIIGAAEARKASSGSALAAGDEHSLLMNGTQVFCNAVRACYGVQDIEQRLAEYSTLLETTWEGWTQATAQPKSPGSINIRMQEIKAAVEPYFEEASRLARAHIETRQRLLVTDPELAAFDLMAALRDLCVTELFLYQIENTALAQLPYVALLRVDAAIAKNHLAIDAAEVYGDTPEVYEAFHEESVGYLKQKLFPQTLSKPHIAVEAFQPAPEFIEAVTEGLAQYPRRKPDAFEPPLYIQREIVMLSRLMTKAAESQASADAALLKTFIATFSETCARHYVCEPGDIEIVVEGSMHNFKKEKESAPDAYSNLREAMVAALESRGVQEGAEPYDPNPALRVFNTMAEKMIGHGRSPEAVEERMNSVITAFADTCAAHFKVSKLEMMSWMQVYLESIGTQKGARNDL